MQPRSNVVLLLSLAVATAGCGTSAWKQARRQHGEVAPILIGSSSDGRSTSRAVRSIGVADRAGDPYRATVSGIRFDDEPFAEALRRIQTITAVPIIVTPAGREAFDGEDLRLDLELVAPMRVSSLLDLMTSRSSELGWSVRDGVVQIGAAADSGGSLRMEVYDVRDLVFARTEFLPPQISGLPSGEREGNWTASEAEDKTFYIEGDVLAEQIKEATGLENWDGDNGASIEYLETGYLIVVAPSSVQGAVRSALR